MRCLLFANCLLAKCILSAAPPEEEEEVPTIIIHKAHTTRTRYLLCGSGSGVVGQRRGRKKKRSRIVNVVVEEVAST